MTEVGKFIRSIRNVDTPENINKLIHDLRLPTLSPYPLSHLWLATGLPIDSEIPVQTDSNVLVFYKAYPMLAVMRPLLGCPACMKGRGFMERNLVEWVDDRHRVMINFANMIECVTFAHGWTAEDCAVYFEKMLKDKS